MSPTNPSVDGYIRKHKEWQEELQKLRTILLECDLTEEIKWRTPCYTLDGKNVAFIGGWTECCVLSFLKGALLKDAKKLLQDAGPNTQAARVVRFANLAEIETRERDVKAYVLEAIAIEKSGAKVQMKKTSDFAMPEELQAKFDELPKFKAAFEALTPGRQRGYLLHFAGAKQSKTRISRVEKCVPQILDRKGLDD